MLYFGFISSFIHHVLSAKKQTIPLITIHAQYDHYLNSSDLLYEPIKLLHVYSTVLIRRILAYAEILSSKLSIVIDTQG